MKITKRRIVGIIFTLIIILVTSLLTDLNTVHRAIAIIILIIIIILILILDIIETKIREYSKRKRIKIIVTEDIKAIKNGKTPTISPHDLDYVLKNSKTFKKIKELNTLFDYFIKKHTLIAKEIEKSIEKEKKRKAEYNKKLLDELKKTKK